MALTGRSRLGPYTANDGLRSDLPENYHVIYQGHHGDTGTVMADCMLPRARPGAIYAEKQVHINSHL